MAGRKTNLINDAEVGNGGGRIHNGSSGRLPAEYGGYVAYDIGDNGGGGIFYGEHVPVPLPTGYMPYEAEDYSDDIYTRQRANANSHQDVLYPSVPSYDGGVEDRWRTAYPYVPTSYSANSLNNSLQQHTTATLPIGDRHESFRLDNKKTTTANGATAGKDVPPPSQEENGEREHWASPWEFIFSCIGLSVGIGNVWRFPTLAYENGGGSFLIPYFIILLLIGKPMYYMELALGQFVQQGPVGVWRICPLGYGVGIAQVVTNVIVSIYYNVLMGYCLFYIFASFQSEVPWSRCSPDWFQGVGADDHCYERKDLINNTARPCKALSGPCETSSEQYFKRAVLGVHKALLVNVTEEVQHANGSTVEQTSLFALNEVGNIGEVKWDITLCLLLAWVIVCGCLVKGIKSSGKVVYFTATFPYVLLIILLIYGCTLPGAADGISAFFVPRKWSGEASIQDPNVWRKAAEQVFYSLSVSWGGLIMFGSYNKFDHKVHITATAISSLDFLTSIIAGIVIFSILGQLKLEAGLDDIDQVIKGGQGLAFIAYPEALSRLPAPQLWAVMFFLMLFLLGLDSEFAQLETILTVIYDAFPKTAKHKPFMVIALCSACFLLSLPCVTNAGTYVFQIMDDYGGGMTIMWVAIIEMIFIMWIYGAHNLNADLNFMLKTDRTICGKINNFILMFLWLSIPILLAIILGVSLSAWESPYYSDSLGRIQYPWYVHGIGIFLILIALLQIPLVALLVCIYYALSPTRRLVDVVRASPDWGPGDPAAFKQYKLAKEAQKRRLKSGGFSALKARINLAYEE